MRALKLFRECRAKNPQDRRDRHAGDGRSHDKRKQTEVDYAAQIHSGRDCRRRRGGRGELPDSCARAQARSFGGERLITLNVNGKPRRVEVMKQETLAWTLRYKLGLTGTKLGCDRAECGACTVLLDDVPHYSCSVLTNTVRGRKVTTIEGLAAADGTLHPVQQAVVDEQGFQCAFCMSGFIMSAVGFLKTNPNPDAGGAGARHQRQSVPVPGLQQDSGRDDARRGIHAGRRACSE